MSKAPKVWPILAAVALQISAAASWEDYRTDAVREGIGYRSNLIDPRNPYASSERRNFGVLLSRLGMIEDWTDIHGGPPHSAPPEESAEESEGLGYSAFLNEILGPYLVDEVLPAMPTVDCDAGRHLAGRTYMEALTSAHEPHPMRARLVAARHRLAPSRWKCLPAEANEMYLEALGAIDGDPWRAWRDYLEGAAHFYADDFDQAVEAFGRVPLTESWLGATAAYMPVRIAFQRVRQHDRDAFWARRQDAAFDHAASAEAYEAHWKRLVDAIAAFRDTGLDGGYREAVLDLRMHAATNSPNPRRARGLFTAEFERHFSPLRNPDGPRKLYAEFKNHQVWARARVVEWNRPFWKVNRLLVALVQADRMRKMSDFDRAYFTPAVALDETRAALSAALDFDRAAFGAGSGLAEYAEALVAFAGGDWRRIVSLVPDQVAPGTPFRPDLLLLKARALAALGDHWESAMTWRKIARQWPALNAAAEAGRQAVKAGRFADFATLDWDLRIARADADDRHESAPLGSIRRLMPWTMRYVPAGEDELMAPAAFLGRERPIHRILREGLARFSEPPLLATIAHDTDVPPLLRWYALEPLLIAALVSGDYDGYIGHAASLLAAAPGLEHGAARPWQRPEATDAYRDILPVVRALAADADDPDSLTTLGYFVYSKRVFPLCLAEGSLWSDELGGCSTSGAGWATGNAPISLFERARTIFERRSTRTDGEARVLRMMIYCFRTETNRESCLRGSNIGSDNKTRAGWFRRLHEHFPDAARETPYWY